MRIGIVIGMVLALTVAYGCTSPRGGGMAKEEGFKIAVPTFGEELKQGETKDVTISLHRGEYFKQDVKLHIKASEGISVSPTEVLVKASETPRVPLRITAGKNANLGEYKIYVKGTPETGEETSTEFNVKVVAP
ncbi:MAG: hypothetical protein ABSH10_03770 [Phycisphaerae bacterium]|jgi:uncharacterized membrane protein